MFACETTIRRLLLEAAIPHQSSSLSLSGGSSELLNRAILLNARFSAVDPPVSLHLAKALIEKLIERLIERLYRPVDDEDAFR